MNTYMRKFKKNAKALSPVVASIILIAVTVAVSVVVAAWMSSSTLGLMGNAEQATITNLGFSNVAGVGADTITVTVQNTGNAPITVTQVLLNTQIPTLQAAVLPLDLAKGATDSTIIISGLDLVVGSDYTVKCTTAKGNNLVLTATCP